VCVRARARACVNAWCVRTRDMEGQVVV